MTDKAKIKTTDEPDEVRRPTNGFDRYFMISERGSTLTREMRGGLATFFTMAYIVILNPLIIGTVPDADGRLLGTTTVAAVTALVAGVMTILMGVIGRYPFAIATGLGLNAFVAFAIASQMSWADAMGLVVLEGLVILVLVLTGLRAAVFRAVPRQLKTAIGAGIGLFIAFIGFVDAGFVRRTQGGPPVELGIGGNLAGWPLFVFCVGLVITAVLMARKVKGAILIGIVATTIVAIVVEAIANIGPSSPDEPRGWQLGVPSLPDSIAESPDLSLIGDFSLFGGFAEVGVLAALLLVFTLMLADFFDTVGTVTAVGQEAGLTDEKGDLPGIQRVLVVDSVAAAAGGAASTSSNTTYIESAAGVGDGARTGVANLVTGGLFLLAMFLAPLVSIVPFEAATPALVIVGFLMFTQVRTLDMDDFGLAIPAFLTIVLMPFTFSITNGIGAGFIAYVLIRLVQGRGREVHPLLYGVAAAFLIYFAIDPLEQLLGLQ
jgi:adenine/guanine/hypoxanthine permease